MSTKVHVPSMGESVTEAVLVKWHKRDGEFVKLDEALAELETDKANVDVPSTAAGVLKRVVQEGAKVRIGDVIATVEPDGKASAGETSRPATSDQAAPAQPPPSPREKLTPASRRMVEEHKLDPSKIPATGPGGRITKEDVVNFLDAGESPGAPPAQSSSQPATDVDPGAAKALTTASVTTPDGPVRRVPMSKIRRKIAENLVKSQQTTATLTTFNEIDMSAAIALRARYKEQFEKLHGVGLGFMSFFAKAVCQALKEWERVNASIDGDDIVYHDYVNLGIAVSTDRGLAVPVLRNAHLMSFARIESEIKRLAQATRDGKLQISELSGGTFTITNGGVFGSLMATPIINPPQVAILGMHAIKDRPVVVNGQVVVRPMMYVALSYDHRIIDGRESVQFLVRVKELVEDPQRLLLEV
ncbi:MAG: 2-oxoglutarate dehydrogenase complex dihydrolipoyllysine-residue succinyltransferase [Phycisphaerae bacterium]|nr:2-oxoglutarate dehydrogenase complex dihydrolipoyllysine-residue succinyltransferase [Phycisphaerae bacterium]MDW8260967.1 2-oxoglutarate dehydrogenase complex dihydrolipoyllysine-residue succinyltransferase [Phycisphaerales bacterium]